MKYKFTIDYYNRSLPNVYLWDSFREPRTPGRDRHSEMEQQCLQQHQITSSSIRRQRQSDRQNPIPQPNFGHPSNIGQVGSASTTGLFAPAQEKIDWNQRLQQGYQFQHAL